MLKGPFFSSAAGSNPALLFFVSLRCFQSNAALLTNWSLQALTSTDTCVANLRWKYASVAGLALRWWCVGPREIRCVADNPCCVGNLRCLCCVGNAALLRCVARCAKGQPSPKFVSGVSAQKSKTGAAVHNELQKVGLAVQHEYTS